MDDFGEFNSSNEKKDETGLSENQILLAFYTPGVLDSGGYTGHFLNRFTAWFTSHGEEPKFFSHVELIIKPPQTQENNPNYITFSVQWVNRSGGVFCCCKNYREKENSNTMHEVVVIADKKYHKTRINYGYISLSVSKKQHEDIYNTITYIVTNRKNYRFNYCGQVTNFLPDYLYSIVNSCLKLPISHKKKKWHKLPSDIGISIPIGPTAEDKDFIKLEEEEEKQFSMTHGFCSEIICKILQNSLGIMVELIPEKISPNHLWTALIEHMRRNMDNPEKNVLISTTSAPDYTHSDNESINEEEGSVIVM